MFCKAEIISLVSFYRKTFTILSIFPVTAKTYPFRIIFKSDGFESAHAAMSEAVNGGGKGFKLRYLQEAC